MAEIKESPAELATTATSETVGSNQEEASTKAPRNHWWIPTSTELLAQAEIRILSKLKLPHKTYAVNIGPVVGGKGDCEIWTLSMNESSKQIPVVFLHGFAAGLCFWTLNLDSLAATRPVYAIDHLGFARSSRPKFSTDPETIEKEFVTAIEEWRRCVGLEKFVLVGHSFGGYLATSYTLSHPSRVAHLVLADPWGFPPPPGTEKWWVKFLAHGARSVNAFTLLRAAGPKGLSLLKWGRGDLIKKFAELNQDGEDVRFDEYIYHCNVQTPSGEIAFFNLIEGLARAKRPMIHRIPDLDANIPVTVILGSVSPIRAISEGDWEEKRSGNKGYVKIHMMEGVGHHVYSESKEKFNEILNDVCLSLDTL